MKQERQRPYERLQALPPVFDLDDLRKSGLSKGSERNALTRWAAAGMVSKAGPRLGIYYNLVRDPAGPESHLGTVLTRIHGQVVVIGACALKERGWTLQVPHVLTVAVPARPTTPVIDGVQTYPRPDVWFDAVRDDIRRAERGPHFLPMLSGSMALADALLHRDSLRHLAPDDIEIPEETGANPVVDACAWMGVGEDAYLPYLEASGLQTALRLPMERAPSLG